MFGCVEIGSEVWFTPKVCKTTSQIPNYIQVWLKNWHHKHKETRLKRLLLQYQGKRTLFLCLFFIGSNLLQRFPKILHFGCVPESCLLPEMIVAPESFAHRVANLLQRFHHIVFMFVQWFSFLFNPFPTSQASQHGPVVALVAGALLQSHGCCTPWLLVLWIWSWNSL